MSTHTHSYLLKKSNNIYVVNVIRQLVLIWYRSMNDRLQKAPKTGNAQKMNRLLGKN